MLFFLGSLPPGFKSTHDCFYMKEWLILHCQKNEYPFAKEFIAANPELDETMNRLLANYLKVNDSQVQVWKYNYRKGMEHSFFRTGEFR